jgi:hypothetical protein
VIILISFGATGCGNFDPRYNPKIDNQNGQIDEIRNNQNGVMAEIGKLKQSAELQNSQLKEVQNGLLNLNNSLSRNENSGIQILQGDGALIMIFSLCVIAMLLWYRDRAIKNEKAANIMAIEIAKLNDPVLNDNVLKAAILNHAESHIYDMLSKQRKNMI